MTRDLRCPSRKHAELPEPGVVEVKCSSRRCGARPGLVVLHRFNTLTGDLTGTVKFRDPNTTIHTN